MYSGAVVEGAFDVAWKDISRIERGYYYPSLLMRYRVIVVVSVCPVRFF